MGGRQSCQANLSPNLQVRFAHLYFDSTGALATGIGQTLGESASERFAVARAFRAPAAIRSFWSGSDPVNVYRASLRYMVDKFSEENYS